MRPCSKYLTSLPISLKLIAYRRDDKNYLIRDWSLKHYYLIELYLLFCGESSYHTTPKDSKLYFVQTGSNDSLKAMILGGNTIVLKRFIPGRTIIFSKSAGKVTSFCVFLPNFIGSLNMFLLFCAIIAISHQIIIIVDRIRVYWETHLFCINHMSTFCEVFIHWHNCYIAW